MISSGDCKAGFRWENTRILKSEEPLFNCIVREALEIQLQYTAPCSDMVLTKTMVNM